MGKIEERKFGGIHPMKFFSRLPYRMECKLEELIIKMAEGMEGKLSDFEDMAISDMDISNLQGFDMAKKMAINDYLLTNAVLKPKITEEDLGDYNHELNDYFKEIGDYLFDKYIAQYSEKTQVKKKLIKSPD
ncbi:MAG: hypothetical protein [Asgard archaea virus VerdaV3]|nr:MAG: hypothetical protein [Asgard archaea virus VerdaV3]